MNNLGGFLIALIIFMGCSTSKPFVVQGNIPVPPIAIDSTQPASSWTFAGDSASFVADILERYCKGEASGSTDGVDWRVILQTLKDENTALKNFVVKPTIRLVVKRDTLWLPIPATITQELNRRGEEIAKLQAQLPTWGYRGTWMLIGALLLVVVGVGLYFVVSRFLPPIKF